MSRRPHEAATVIRAVVVHDQKPAKDRLEALLEHADVQLVDAVLSGMGSDRASGDLARQIESRTRFQSLATSL